MICLFFFNDTATTEIYTLSLHDALPICSGGSSLASAGSAGIEMTLLAETVPSAVRSHSHTEAERSCRSEEHTSELQSRQYLVCRLLLEKKNNTRINTSLSTLTQHSDDLF